MQKNQLWSRKKYFDKFAQFFRLQYVITTGVFLVVLLGSWIWYEHKKAEEIHRRLISNCIFFCLSRQADKIGEKAFRNPSIMKECIDFCEKQYGQYINKLKF